MILDLFAGPGGCVPPPPGAWDNGNGYWSVKQRMCRECSRERVRARRRADAS